MALRPRTITEAFMMSGGNAFCREMNMMVWYSMWFECNGVAMVYWRREQCRGERVTGRIQWLRRERTIA